MAAAKNIPPKKSEGAQPNALRIVSSREGFRREGRAWTVSPTTVLLDDLSEDAVTSLKAESMLMVEEVTVAVDTEDQGEAE